MVIWCNVHKRMAVNAGNFIAVRHHVTHKSSEWSRGSSFRYLGLTLPALMRDLTGWIVLETRLWTGAPEWQIGALAFFNRTTRCRERRFWESIVRLVHDHAGSAFSSASSGWKWLFASLVTSHLTG
jgi:hypothetical protein